MANILLGCAGLFLSGIVTGLVAARALLPLMFSSGVLSHPAGRVVAPLMPIALMVVVAAILGAIFTRVHPTVSLPQAVIASVSFLGLQAGGALAPGLIRLRVRGVPKISVLVGRRNRVG